MPDKNELLDELTRARASFKAYVDWVDADLAQERERRIVKRQDEIWALVAQAFAAGATKADLKRAYGSKDHKTIVTILESRKGQIEAIQEQAKVEAPVAPHWFEVTDGGLYVTIEDDWYSVIPLEDGEYLLDQGEGDINPRWDGRVLSRLSTGDEQALYEALKEVRSEG